MEKLSNNDDENYDDEILNIKFLPTIKKRILNMIPIYIIGIHSAGWQILSLALNSSSSEEELNYSWKVFIWSIYLFFLAIAAWIEKTLEYEKLHEHATLFNSMKMSCISPIMLIIYTLGVFEEPLFTFINIGSRKSLIKAIQFIILLFGFLILGTYNLIRSSQLKQRKKSIKEEELNI